MLTKNRMLIQEMLIREMPTKEMPTREMPTREMPTKNGTGLNRIALRFAAGCAAGFACLLPFAVAPCRAQGTPAKDDMTPIPLKLPKPAFAGTPKDVPAGTTVDKAPTKPRPLPLAPKGVVNLALGKKVTSSAAPYSGSLELITDGNKEVGEETAVEIKPRVQWVQIDLGAVSPLYYVLVWHYHGQPIVFHSVIVQASNDPQFIDGVTTLFNNDQINAAGMGIGKDREYFETNEGKLIDAKGVKARYVRLYSKGSTYQDPLNRYTEVEAWGLPPTGGK